MHDRAAAFFRDLQDRICAGLARADGGATFREDRWDRPGGGGGRTRVIADGVVIEKGGVSFSEVYGEFPPDFAKQLPGDGTKFTATGVSLVIHPGSPLVPTVHANFRYLTHGSRAWFGGGADLTPYYPFKEDVVHFHTMWKRVCERHPGVADHAKMKRDCDEYFFLKHRNEPRGVGGIFFDYLDATDAVFAFVRAAGDAVLDAYVPIVDRRKDLAYTPEQRVFQEYRRGRYVEFNLVYDRGTIFGLKTDGRTESILMSLPPVVRYVYDFKPTPGSREAELTEYWLKPRDWAAEAEEHPGR
ncbi:MAG: oxygen-dependent coproporphyrinogen oxidase [Gemmataceae bacterium]|nr:oxygen-dependent coproporphyrinogen oxidase [Gemmataceae bacterium]